MFNANGSIATLSASNSGQFDTTYDPLGNVTKVIDPAGVPTIKTYDNLGRMLTQVSFDFSRRYCIQCTMAFRG